MMKVSALSGATYSLRTQSSATKMGTRGFSVEADTDADYDPREHTDQDTGVTYKEIPPSVAYTSPENHWVSATNVDAVDVEFAKALDTADKFDEIGRFKDYGLMNFSKMV